MKFRIFSRKNEAQEDEPKKPEDTSLEPEKLLPEGLSDKQKRRIFFGVAGVISLIILANLLAPNSPAPTGKEARSSSGVTQAGPTPAQMAEFQANLRQTEQQFQEAEEAKQRALAEAKGAPSLTAEDLQNAEALREATAARQQYAQTVGAQVTPQQQLQSERAQQAYKSLFADNMVRQENVSTPAVPKSESLPQQSFAVQQEAAASEPATQPAAVPVQSTHKTLNFDPNKQPTYWLPEGTIIEAVLTNRLDGAQPGPVNAMITTDVYRPGTRLLLIPAGTHALGQASQVSAFGQQRLAVAFHRLLVPGLFEYSIPLDKAMPGLAQAGEAGLQDKVDNHYFSIFGASLAIGAIGGLAQIGNSGSALTYDPSAQFRNGVSQSMAQSSDRVLDKFLNRMPTITIREGTRIKILLTDDLEVPAYSSMNSGDF